MAAASGAGSGAGAAAASGGSGAGVDTFSGASDERSDFLCKSKMWSMAWKSTSDATLSCSGAPSCAAATCFGTGGS